MRGTPVPWHVTAAPPHSGSGLGFTVSACDMCPPAGASQSKSGGVAFVVEGRACNASVLHEGSYVLSGLAVVPLNESFRAVWQQQLGLDASPRWDTTQGHPSASECEVSCSPILDLFAIESRSKEQEPVCNVRSDFTVPDWQAPNNKHRLLEIYITQPDDLSFGCMEIDTIVF